MSRWLIDDACKDLKNIIQILATKESETGEDYDVFVGGSKAVTVKAETPDHAIKIARKRLFENNPGTLGAYDGAKVAWSAKIKPCRPDETP
jgi:hypothetical protein